MYLFVHILPSLKNATIPLWIKENPWNNDYNLHLYFWGIFLTRIRLNAWGNAWQLSTQISRPRPLAIQYHKRSFVYRKICFWTIIYSSTIYLPASHTVPDLHFLSQNLWNATPVSLSPLWFTQCVYNRHTQLILKGNWSVFTQQTNLVCNLV